MNPKNRAKDKVQVRTTVLIIIFVMCAVMYLVGGRLQLCMMLFLMLINIFNFIWGGKYADK